MDMLLYVCGIVIAVLILAVALAITVFFYLRYCSKHPMQKRKAEIFVVVSVFILSLAIRVIIGFCRLPDESINGGASSVLYGIITTVAGFMFDGTADISDLGLANGIIICLYYGIIAYSGFVFLIVITVGISYDLYSHIQTSLMRFRKNCSYYIFTSINEESLVLAEDIKKRELSQKGHSHVIIFFENGEDVFSRKNPLHRRIMEDGFYYFSDPRCKDNGETVCFLSKFKFKHKHCVKDDVAENHGKLFYVIAFDNFGEYEGGNADIVFDDLQATLKAYVYKKKNTTCNALPTVLNYYVLTSGSVNFESYERRTNETITNHIKNLPQRDNLYTDIDTHIQINVINEAILSSHSLVLARREHLGKLGTEAFSTDSKPDKNVAYRVAVIGFGKTGECVMEELYTQTANIVKDKDGYAPTQFIADIFDTKIEDKSGMFAYNHPLFRCIDEKQTKISDTQSIIDKSKSVGGKAIDVLYSEYMELSQKSLKEAEDFIDKKMAFPIAVMHKGNCFGYPFLSEEGTETAISAAIDNDIRDFVVSLGCDERNIEMANMIIDSFRRLFLKNSLAGEKLDLPHIKVYVNIIDKKNISLLNWRWEDDEKLFSQPYAYDKDGNLTDSPQFSVIPFGFLEEMYSYAMLIEDYKERIYNYGYNLLTEMRNENQTLKEKAIKDYSDFRSNLSKDYNYYRKDEKAIDQWMTISQYLRLSNKSALDFSINYYRYAEMRGGKLTVDDYQYMIRLEHERWDRFFISHGWIYAKYFKNVDISKLDDGEKKKIKNLMRGARQHNCLCPFDEMLDDCTKDYDRGNVELGLIEGIVFGNG